MGLQMEEESSSTERKNTRRDVLRLVEDAIETLELEVKAGSCTDFTRLLQLQRELSKQGETENIRKIEVTWIDSSEMECYAGK
jgi:hypothetical protein